MTGRTIALGDMHGCPKALAALVEAIRPGPDDTLVTLGDYIDRGPDSRGVLDLLLSLAGRCRLVPLLGNHEEMLLLGVRNPAVLESWLACGGIEALHSYGWTPEGPPRPLDEIIPAGHWRFLAGCRASFETDTHLFTHANYDPLLPMDQQPAEALRWRSVDRHTAKPHRSGKVAVVGHTPQRRGQILDLGFLKCIDTGCHFGKWLTALDVHSGEVWQASKWGRLRKAKPGPPR